MGESKKKVAELISPCDIGGDGISLWESRFVSDCEDMQYMEQEIIECERSRAPRKRKLTIITFLMTFVAFLVFQYYTICQQHYHPYELNVLSGLIYQTCPQQKINWFH